MIPEGDAPRETYAVSCFNCKALFDALQVAWCNCVVSKRSLVCPSCLNCFCRASPVYKRGFWQGAPKSLWEKLLAEHQGDFQPPPNPGPTDVARPLVLIVDDEKDIQRMTLRVIEGLGYGVVLARDGEEGMELARTYAPDLVLTDAFMPKLDGREMCLRIKEDPATAKTKVVVMTSLYTATRYKYEAFRQFKADDYLTKPLEFRQLQAVLVKYLS